MEFLFEFLTIVDGYNLYRVFLIDTDTYYCTPTVRRDEYFFHYHPEFYVGKNSKGRWVSYNESEDGSYIAPYLVEDAITAIKDYLFNEKYKLMKQEKE